MTERDENEYRVQRLENMRRLAEMGHEPFGRTFERTGRLSEIRDGFAEEREVTAAGRLMTIRKMGKSIFADLRDGTDRFQIYVQKNELGEDHFAAFKLLDAGDQIGVKGSLFTTRTGEPTIKVAEWTLLAKALLPLPEKWHGLKDVDTRYRQRYLDLIANPNVRQVFDKRMAIVREMRSYLEAEGFVEVETPMMQPQAGGAAAKPFVAHYAALGRDMYFRIAPELYLKRLLVGGFDKVFELNRCFRNEGIDRTHVPEFTMLEIYQAYTDVNGMKKLVQGMITHVARSVCDKLEFPWGDETVKLGGAWREVPYKDLVKGRMGDDWYDLPLEEARKLAETQGLDIAPDWDMTLISHEVYEKLLEDTLVQPTFVTRLPASLVPLAKTCEDDPSVVDVFELVMAGQEIAPAYSELNDPIAQRERLSGQAGENQEKVDEDFLAALEHGMPPAGGMGIGVDRIVMLLTGCRTIRDVILFPQLKPKE